MTISCMRNGGSQRACRRIGGVGYNLLEDIPMHTHRLKVMIPEDRQLHVRMPEEVPTGPAEIIVFTETPVAREPEEPSREEASRRFRALAKQFAADPRPFDELSDEEREARIRQVMGIGRGLLSSSEEFAREKQEEIDREIEREERRFGRR